LIQKCKHHTAEEEGREEREEEFFNHYKNDLEAEEISLIKDLKRHTQLTVAWRRRRPSEERSLIVEPAYEFQ